MVEVPVLPVVLVLLLVRLLVLPVVLLKRACYENRECQVLVTWKLVMGEAMTVRAESTITSTIKTSMLAMRIKCVRYRN